MTEPRILTREEVAVCEHNWFDADNVGWFRCTLCGKTASVVEDTELAALRARVEALEAERDEAVSRIPSMREGDRLVLNAYGRRCYDAGRASALPPADAPPRLSEAEVRTKLSDVVLFHATTTISDVNVTPEGWRREFNEVRNRLCNSLFAPSGETPKET